MAKVDVNFSDQLRKNLEFQENYGSRKSVFSPHWTGSEGDRAAIMRMVYPSPQAKAYFKSPAYNAFTRNYVTTALQGQGKTIADPVQLTQADYHPEVGRSKNIVQTFWPFVDMKWPEKEKEIYLSLAVLFGGVSYLLFL